MLILHYVYGTKVKKMRDVSIIILFMMMALKAIATPAYPYPVEVIQPDGSRIMMMIKGDESLRYRTSIMGNRMVMDEAGFYTPTFDTPVYTPSRQNIRPVSSKSISTLVIPVQFTDVKFKVDKPEDHFEKMMNLKGYSENDATGSVKEYFEINLRGVRDVSFTVSKVISLSHNLAYYGENKEDARSSSPKYDVRVEEMIREACSKLDGEVNFSKYNYVFVYYAGYSEAEGGDEDAIWPASIDISSNPIKFDGASISTVGCGSELRGSSGATPAGIGAFCHEFGHILGLPDLYDVDYQENGRSKGMWGTLSLMDYGCYNNKGRTPPYFNAIERELLGVEGERLKINTLHYLEPVNLNGKFYRVDTQEEGEYFLIESRMESGWDSHIGGSGMLIYHIDKSSNPAGMITASVRWDNNLINTFAGHECADLVESTPAAVNVKEVFFPGLDNVTTFATLTNPHFVDWKMRGVGLKLEDIKVMSEENGVSFMVSRDNDEILMKADKIETLVRQRSVAISWETPFDIAAKWGIRWRAEGREFGESDKMMTEYPKCVIENLRGGERYECEIYHIGSRSNGDTVTVKFKTADITSPYPFIEGLARPIHVGDTLSLSIYNLNEMEDKIVWYIDNREVKDKIFMFDSEGEYDIRARIHYIQDGSIETINRKITVRENGKDIH